MPPGVVLFDFFGTLVHYSASRTEQGYSRSFACLQRAGCKLDHAGFLELWSGISEELDARAARTLREFSMEELGRAFFARAFSEAPPRETLRAFLETYLSEWNRGVRPIPGLPAALEELARTFRLAVITNTHDADLVPKNLRALGIADHFELVVTSVEHGERKPHRSIFEAAIRRLGVTPGECCYVGDDRVADYDGATAAGLRAFLVDPDGGAGVAPADRLGSVLELEARLAAERGPAMG